MQDYELKWLLDLHFEFAKNYGVDPDLLSDWEPDPVNFKFPEKLVQSAIKSDPLNYRYHFLYGVKAIKEKVANYYNNLNTYSDTLKIENIALLPGVTSALFLMFLAFKKKGLKRGLGVRPIYFSIRESCNNLDITLELIDSFSTNDYIADLSEIKQKLLTKAYDFFVLTNPVYVAGKQLEPEYIDEIQKICKETDTLLVMDEAFVIPWGEGARYFNSYSPTDTIIIRSPMKAMYINGIKVATLTGPDWLVGSIEGESTSVLGGITYPQLSLADKFYSYTPDVKSEVEACNINNFELMRSNYLEIKQVVQKFPGAHLANANSNPYGLIECPNISNKKEDLEDVLRTVLNETKCMILPSWRYSFTTSNNPFAFRVNLARANNEYLQKLESVLKVLNLYKYNG